MYINYALREIVETFEAWMVLCLWVFLMRRKLLIDLNTLYYFRSWLTAKYQVIYYFRSWLTAKNQVILLGSWYIGMLVKQCMYVGQEYCHTDFTLWMVYDKVAFCLLTYLINVYMDDLNIALSRVAQAAVWVILLWIIYVCGWPSNFFTNLVLQCEKIAIRMSECKLLNDVLKMKACDDDHSNWMTR